MMARNKNPVPRSYGWGSFAVWMIVLAFAIFTTWNRLP